MLELYYYKRKAVTLVEILLAMVLMAGAFLPIMAMMSTSIKATEKDENTQRAVRLCQEKLNMALQMPFNTFTSSDSPQSGTKKGDIELKLGTETFDGISYTSTLIVKNEPINFVIPTVDWASRYDENYKNDPSKWGFSEVTRLVTDKVKRYTLKVTWQDRGLKQNEKYYTLSALKADVRDDRQE